MKKRHRPNIRSTGVAFFASLLGHGLVVLYLTVLTQPTPSPPSPQQGEIVPLLSKQQVDRLLRRSQRPPKAQQEKKPEPEPPQERPRGQVVEITPPQREQRPKEARFLAEFNSAVEREMVHVNAAAPRPEMRRSERRSVSGGDDMKGARRGERGVKRRSAPREATRPPRRERSQARSQQAQSAPKRAPLKRVVPEGEGPFKRQEEERSTSSQRAQRGEAAQPEQRLGSLAPTHYRSLLPTLGPQELSRLEGSIDRVVEVPKGRQTALNTREYRFAHFFNRVKREVSERWRAIEVYRARDPRGQVYGVKDRHTVINVTLDSSGALAGVELLQSCGIMALDLEAIEAFKRAQPFHNPPKGLADPDGKIRFKFGFFLEIQGGGFRFLP